uniref:Reverse transcriptase domain-containing protein n=1 Tax=Schistocephalus solidus TaxID=70667 RepID=A0A183TN45_SCHSO
LDRFRSAPGIQFSNSNRSVTCQSSEDCVVLASTGLSRGVHYWEFVIDRLDSGGQPAFGIAKSDCNKEAMLGQVHQDFKDATIVHLYKRKGNRQLCDNHRGISLLKIAAKLFARILLNRLDGHLAQGMLPKSQCGFRRHRGTTDMIFAARQLQEKCQEMLTHLYTTFVDLTKAFDTVNRDGLWKVMQKFGCPKRFSHMVRQLHDGMTARVTDNRTVSEAFAVTNVVKQGCVLAPTLFSLMFSAMLMDAYLDEQPGIHIAYRTDGHILNSRRM